MTCDLWDIVVVPFPFTERPVSNKRPAAALSNRTFNERGHTLLAMITSSSLSWPSDVSISGLDSAGLSTPCAVRLKVFTLDNRLIMRRIGQLSGDDRGRVAAELRAVLPL